MHTIIRSSSEAHRNVSLKAASASILLLLAFLVLAPASAHAQTLQVPFIQEFGCSVVQWLKGPLAILIFILVCVAALVIGMITKMDWARIITV